MTNLAQGELPFMRLNSLLNTLLAPFGVELRRAGRSPLPATPSRPVGDLSSVLADMAHRGFRPQTIVDIGANRGSWSEAVARVFPEANFFLIEPIAGFEPD